MLLVPVRGGARTGVDPGKRGDERVTIDPHANPSLVFWKMPVSPLLGSGQEDETAKKAFLRALKDLFNGSGGLKGVTASLVERRAGLLRELQTRGVICKYQKIRVQTPMALGVGLPHLYESGLSLSHLYGVPVVPGSSVRGVVRHYAFSQIAETLGVPRLPYEEWAQRKLDGAGELRRNPEPTPLERLEALLAQPAEEEGTADPDRSEVRRKLEDELRALKEDLYSIDSSNVPLCTASLETLLQNQDVRCFRSLFGTTWARGRGVFFDAILEDARFDLDVVAPHHTPYYEQGKPPADWYAPKPHFYLVVCDASAHLALAATPARREDEPDSEGLLETAWTWTETALRDWGVGAKTRLGYGKLTPSSQPVPG